MYTEKERDGRYSQSKSTSTIINILRYKLTCQ